MSVFSFQVQSLSISDLSSKFPIPFLIQNFDAWLLQT